MDTKVNEASAGVKLVALLVVGSVAKALFAPPRTYTIREVVDTAQDVVEKATKKS